MLLRILTALVGVPLLIGTIWLGFPWLTVLVAAIALLALWEFYRMAPIAKGPLVPILGALWTTMFIASGQLAHDWHNYFPHILLGAAAAFSLPGLLVLRGREGFPAFWVYAVSGPVYTGFLLAHALMLREFSDDADLGRDFLIFALLVTFATDTGSFLIGMALGRHTMAPSISPHKTWEGALGGFSSAIAISFALGALLQLSVPIWQHGLVGAAVGVSAQLGDLVESRLKRATGVKDAGSILPGHGGLLDRLDSIVFTLPVVYYLVALALDPSA